MVKIEGEDHHYMKVVDEIAPDNIDSVGSIASVNVVDVLDRSMLDPTGTGNDTNIVCDKVEDCIGGFRGKIAYRVRTSVLGSLC
jgi:hypothetical protein